MGEWLVGGGHAVGAMHQRHGQPGEDAHLVRHGELSYVAVSDGHGSARCTRSAAGAALAVRAVDEVLQPLDHVVSPQDWAGAVIRRWRTACDEHLDTHALTPEEHDIVAAAPTGTGHHFLYGATLMVATAESDELGCLKIGDGDILISSDGSWQRALNGRELVSTETESLCLPDATERALTGRWRVSAKALVTLSTDGFAAAFEDDDWPESVIHDIWAHLDHAGGDNLGSTIDAWCEGPAAVGGDDATLALVARGVRSGV